MKKLLILFLLPVQLAFSQQEIFLEDCYAHARENYPNLQQEVIWQQITAFKKENLITTERSVQSLYRIHANHMGRGDYFGKYTFGRCNFTK